MSVPQGLCMYCSFWIALLSGIYKVHSLTSFKGHLSKAVPDDPICKGTAAPTPTPSDILFAYPALFSSYHLALTTWQLSKIIHIYFYNTYYLLSISFLTTVHNPTEEKLFLLYSQHLKVPSAQYAFDKYLLNEWTNICWFPTLQRHSRDYDMNHPNPLKEFIF